MTSPDRRTIFFLPGLGFSAAEAAPLAAALGEGYRVVGIDLPGQNRSPDAADGSVHAMADAALTVIEAEADGGPWLLAAHSMGGKVAALVASRILAGRANVFGLAGAVLLAPSPPIPEPMDDGKRAQMLSWVDGGALQHNAVSRADATEFVAQNVATPLPGTEEQDAVDQVTRTSPLSWRRWLTEGSLEDCSRVVGVLELPVVVLAGEDDDDLGASAQPRLLSAVYPRARFVSLPATGHLLPYERPREVAAEIARLWESTVDASPQLSAEWGRVIGSDRTPVEARALLARRAIVDDENYCPRALSPRQLTTLRALADRLVPQPGNRRIDLAARVDADLASGRGDGWRPAGLPDDVSAYRLGLDTIAASWPDTTELQDALIRRIIAGEPFSDGAGDSAWDSDALRSWFDDLRNDLVRTWVAHPASLARLGYDGLRPAARAPAPLDSWTSAQGSAIPGSPPNSASWPLNHRQRRTLRRRLRGEQR